MQKLQPFDARYYYLCKLCQKKKRPSQVGKMSRENPDKHNNADIFQIYSRIQQE